jgi:hypothetical protein
MNVSKIATLLLSMWAMSVPLRAQRILYVGGNSEANPRKMDQDLVDSLDAWGYEATYLSAGAYRSANVSVYNGYDGIWINESVGSTDVARFGPDGFPLDIIVMEPAPLAGAWGLGMGIEATEGASGDYILRIDQNDHYITEPYTVGQELIICSNPQYDHTGILFDPQGVVSDKLASVTNTAKRGGGLISPGGFEVGTINASTDRPIRMCMFCLTSPNYDDRTTANSSSAVNHATEDFYSFVKRCADWTFKDADQVTQIAPAGGSLSQPQALKVYQDGNPFRIMLGYHSPGNETVRAQLFNLSGQPLAVLMDGQTDPGNNFFQIDRSAFPAGLYIVRLETPSDVLTTKVFMTNN